MFQLQEGESPPQGIELVPLARVSVAAGDRHQIKGGPFGNRVIASISEGRWDGDRLAGKIVGAGGDWAMWRIDDLGSASPQSW